MEPQRSLHVTWQDPMLTARGAQGRTGLEFLRAILDGTLPPAPVQFTLDFALVSVAEGEVAFECVPGEQHYNPMASVHGGVVSTLLDSAMGASVMSTLDARTGYTTVELSVHLTRAVTARTGPVRAAGRVLHRGARLVTAEGRLTDADGKLLAHGTTSCLLVERP